MRDEAQNWKRSRDIANIRYFADSVYLDSILAGKVGLGHAWINLNKISLSQVSKQYKSFWSDSMTQKWHYIWYQEHQTFWTENRWVLVIINNILIRTRGVICNRELIEFYFERFVSIKCSKWQHLHLCSTAVSDIKLGNLYFAWLDT